MSVKIEDIQRFMAGYEVTLASESKQIDQHYTARKKMIYQLKDGNIVVTKDKRIEFMGRSVEGAVSTYNSIKL